MCSERMQRALTSPGLPLLALPGNQEGLLAIRRVVEDDIPQVVLILPWRDGT